MYVELPFSFNVCFTSQNKCVAAIKCERQVDIHTAIESELNDRK